MLSTYSSKSPALRWLLVFSYLLPILIVYVGVRKLTPSYRTIQVVKKSLKNYAYT